MNHDNDIRPTTSSSHKPQPKTVSFSGKTLVNIAILIIAIGLSFWGGIVYQSHHTQASATTTASGSGFSGGFGSRRSSLGRRSGGGFGSVSSLSATSITIVEASGGSKTFAITSSTTITDGGQTVAYSDIANGDVVLIIPDSSDSSDASRIIVSPSYGGGFAAPGGSQSSSSSSTGGGSSSN